jgi:hypothetical protein
MMASIASTDAIMPKMRVPRASDTSSGEFGDVGVELSKIEMLEYDPKGWVRLEANGAIVVDADGRSPGVLLVLMTMGRFRSGVRAR